MKFKISFYRKQNFQKGRNPESVCKKQDRIISGLVLLTLLIITMSGQITAQPSAAGDPVVLIPSGGQGFVNAAWSPDGQSLAFSSSNYKGIWLSDFKGQNVKLLTPDEGIGFGFTWSPDGGYILGRAATFENRRRFHDVKIIDVNTSEQEVLLEKSRELTALPIWTPQGDRVAIVAGNDLQFRSSEKLQLKKSSNDQTGVIYSINGRLFNTNFFNKSNIEIAAFEGRNIFNISVSPHGDKVAFQVRGKGLFVMNTNGSGLQNVGFGERASWMPDGRFVIVTIVEDDGHVITGGELYAVNVVSGEYHHLTAHTNLIALKPNVSPDGKWVAFDNPNDGNIYIMPLKY